MNSTTALARTPLPSGSPTSPPAAVSPDGWLLLSCPTSARSWIATRYPRVMAAIAETVDRPFRLMTDREQQLHAALEDLTDPLPHPDYQEAV